MLERIKKALDRGKCFGILLTDLSKAFDSISHELLIAKLYAYGFSLNSLKLISEYLSDRMQRTKVGNSYSSWRQIIFGFPQGSILGVLLFNIYINDLFLSLPDIDMANYADDNSPYELNDSINDVVEKLREDSRYLLEWFERNYLVPNPDKWHLLLGNTGENLSICIQNNIISNTDNEKILGVYFDKKLNFNYHISRMCQKASQKLHALARVSNYMSCKQKLTIMNAFIYSQFCYCPLIWMCHSRSNNTRINKIHERSLRIVYKDEISTFKELCKRSKSVTVHHRNLQILGIEIYKAVNNLSSSLMSELFKRKENRYNFRRKDTLAVSRVRTTRYSPGASGGNISPIVYTKVILVTL